MKKTIYNIKTLAALLLMGTAVMTSCGDDEDIVFNGSPIETPQTAKTYTMTVVASKGEGALTKALSLDTEDGKTYLNATWATTENVYVKKGSDWATGSLQPQEAGTETTLKGTLSDITISADDELTLQFPKSGDISYSGQLGTLADIAANFDYATATVTVASISAAGNIIPTADEVAFENQQAIVKFTQKDADGNALVSNPSAFTITDATSTVELTSIPATTYTTNGAGVLYVAFPATGSSATISLTATVGSDTYTYEKSGVTFTNGQYYDITVKMVKQSSAAVGHALSESVVGEVVGIDGLAYAVADKDNLPSGVTAAGMVAYKSGSNGLVLALSDDGTMNYSTAASGKSGAAAHTPTVTGYTWKLPSAYDWQHMFNGCGSNSTYIEPLVYIDDNDIEFSYGSINTNLGNVGGTALQIRGYWSSTENGACAWTLHFSDLSNGHAYFYNDDSKDKSSCVRACLAF